MESKKIYVDKTEYIWDSLTHKALYLTLNRRMGKTLTLGVIEAIYTKKKEWWEKNASDTWIY